MCLHTQLLCSTEVMARGIDIPDLPFVVNFDVPPRGAFVAPLCCHEVVLEERTMMAHSFVMTMMQERTTCTEPAARAEQGTLARPSTWWPPCPTLSKWAEGERVT
jgi:hypothetical protein